jgi:RecA-family ATPase
MDATVGEELTNIPALVACRREMALAKTPPEQLAALKRGLLPLAVPVSHRLIEKHVVVDTIFEQAEAIGLRDSVGDDVIATTLERALDPDAAEFPPPTSLDEFGASPLADESAKRELSWLDFSKWDDEPIPERQWAIRDRVPQRQAGLFSGEGGTGKSIIELMKNVAHVAGRDWLGSLPEQGPAFYIGAEDDADEIHIRLAAIAEHYGVTFRELTDSGLRVLCLLGQDATLCAAGESGKVETTALYRKLYEAAGDLKPKNISIDTLSRAFAGSEIDRVQVYSFAMHMQALAMVANGSVTVLSHPSLQGISSGSGISGSTAWHGAFRFRQFLRGVKTADGEQPDSDLRELQFKKNQYGPLGEKIVLRYERGLFLPVVGMSSIDRAADESKADQEFLDMLRRFTEQGRNVSATPTSPTYAATLFAKEPVGRRKADYEAAMRRLFATNKIRVEEYGRPSRPYSRLVEA